MELQQKQQAAKGLCPNLRVRIAAERKDTEASEDDNAGRTRPELEQTANIGRSMGSNWGKPLPELLLLLLLMLGSKA